MTISGACSRSACALRYLKMKDSRDCSLHCKRNTSNPSCVLGFPSAAEVYRHVVMSDVRKNQVTPSLLFRIDALSALDKVCYSRCTRV